MYTTSNVIKIEVVEGGFKLTFDNGNVLVVDNYADYI